jgi:hypothetical protein
MLKLFASELQRVTMKQKKLSLISMQPDCKKIHAKKLLASRTNKRDSLLGGKRDNQ